MAFIRSILTTLFGGQRNVISEVVETFRPNAEASDKRAADVRSAALAQFAAEFANPQTGAFDRFVDGLNRLPRPLMALGTIGLFVLLIVDPVTFSSRMAALDLMPEEMWWVTGGIVGFYFGARELKKRRDHALAISSTDAKRVIDNIRQIEALDQPDDTASFETRRAPRAKTSTKPDTAVESIFKSPTETAQQTASGRAGPVTPTGNAAIDAWQAGRDARS